jgi:ribokinase
MSLLVVGNTVVDVIFPGVPQLPRWPRHTEFTRTNLALVPAAPLVTLGGNGANAAYVAARCGARVALHSPAGADPFGKLAARWLRDAGCRVRVPQRPQRTAVNVTAANARFQRATLFYPGAAPTLPRAVRGFRRVLVCGWPHSPWPELARRLGAWRRAGIWTALDAGPILGRAPTLAELRPVFAGLDLLLLNRHEAQAITRTRTPAAAAHALRRGCSGDLVIKLGADGALWLPAGSAKPQRVPGHRIVVANTVGAGDTFNGALLAALERGRSFPAALRFANAMAASVVRSARGVVGVRPPRGWGD